MIFIFMLVVLMTVPFVAFTLLYFQKLEKTKELNEKFPLFTNHYTFYIRPL